MGSTAASVPSLPGPLLAGVSEHTGSPPKSLLSPRQASILYFTFPFLSLSICFSSLSIAHSNHASPSFWPLPRLPGAARSSSSRPSPSSLHFLLPSLSLPYPESPFQPSTSLGVSLFSSSHLSRSWPQPFSGACSGFSPSDVGSSKFPGAHGLRLLPRVGTQGEGRPRT